MKAALPLLLAVLAAGCAGSDGAHGLKGAQYGALGHDPFWTVAVGKDNVVLTLGTPGGSADGELSSVAYPRALAEEKDGVRRWESSEGTKVIAIEARREPCRAGGWSYEDSVKVYLSGRMLEGCGGKGEPVKGRG